MNLTFFFLTRHSDRNAFSIGYLRFSALLDVDLHLDSVFAALLKRCVHMVDINVATGTGFVV